MTLAGCGSETRQTVKTPAHSSTSSTVPPPATTTTVPRVVHGPIPPPHPGPPKVISKGPPSAKAANQVAITIDDGYCVDCANAYVAFAQSSGVHITFSPNGRYNAIWSPLAETLKPLIETGQVQIGNHTYNHPDLKTLSDTAVRTELERNEAWVEQVFGITARPWWRPPYGFHNARTDEIAATLGFTNVLMWNGSLGDSVVLTAPVLLDQARKYFNPGVIMLGHANHPTVTTVFPQITQIIAERQLHPVTLDRMFGTSRDAG